MTLLGGEGIVLREIKEEDSQRVVRWRNAELPNEVFFTKEPLTIQKQREWIKAYLQNQSDNTFIIEKDGTPVGMVALYNIIHGDTAEFGRLLIGEIEFRDRGIATKASRMVLEHGFRNLKLKTIYASVFEHNKSAVKLYFSLGFSVTGKQCNQEKRVILNMSVTQETINA